MESFFFLQNTSYLITINFSLPSFHLQIPVVTDFDFLFLLPSAKSRYLINRSFSFSFKLYIVIAFNINLFLHRLNTFLYAISNSFKLACWSSFVCFFISSGSTSSFLAKVSRSLATNSLSLSHYKNKKIRIKIFTQIIYLGQLLIILYLFLW